MYRSTLLSLVWTVLSGLFLGGVSSAESIEVSGVLRGVDKPSRIISLERKTVNGPKIIDLEVAENVIDAAELQVGAAVSVLYETNLELVTKVEADKPVQAEEGCRVSLKISDTGDCILSGGRPSRPATDSQRTKQPDGTWEMLHVFRDPDELKIFKNPFGPLANAKWDRKQKGVMLTPGPFPGFTNKAAQVTYPYIIRVPISVAVDLGADAACHARILASPQRAGLGFLAVTVTSDDGFEKDGELTAAWVTRDNGGKPSFKELVKEENVSFDKPLEKRFRLPIPNLQHDHGYLIQLGASGNSGVALTQLVVSGTPRPTLGIKLAEQDGILFAEKVLPGMAAAAAGIKAGDALLAVNGERPGSVNEVLRMFSRLPIDEPAELKIKRGGKELTLTITPMLNQE